MHAAPLARRRIRRDSTRSGRRSGPDFRESAEIALTAVECPRRRADRCGQLTDRDRFRKHEVDRHRVQDEIAFAQKPLRRCGRLEAATDPRRQAGRKFLLRANLAGALSSSWSRMRNVGRPPPRDRMHSLDEPWIPPKRGRLEHHRREGLCIGYFETQTETRHVHGGDLGGCRSS